MLPVPPKREDDPDTRYSASKTHPYDSDAFDAPDISLGDDDDLITVATFRTAPEAELAKTALDAEGIESFIADAEMVTMDWLLGVAIGDVKIQVARRVAERARDFLASRRRVHDEDEPVGPATCLACGAVFPEEADQCPACGWSFEDKASLS